MTWTANTNIRDDGAVEVTAVFTDPQTSAVFSYGATIKQDQASIDTFVQEAQKYLTAEQANTTATDTFQTILVTALNK